MEIVIFQGELRMGDSVDATMAFAQEFRLLQCATRNKKLTVEAEGVQILGTPETRDVASHSVFFDGLHVGKMSGDRTELTILPEAFAGPHRVEIRVSTLPGSGLCDDFILKRVAFSGE
jgi:hypothetical protein